MGGQESSPQKRLSSPFLPEPRGWCVPFPGALGAEDLWQAHHLSGQGRPGPSPSGEGTWFGDIWLSASSYWGTNIKTDCLSLRGGAVLFLAAAVEMKWASCSPLGIRRGEGKLGDQSQTVNKSNNQWLTSFLCVTWQRCDWWRFFFVSNVGESSVP